MKTRHIIQVSAYYPPHLGGQENAVHSLAHELASAGNTIDVVTSAQDAQKGIAIEHGVRVNRLQSFVFGHAPVMPWFPIALLRTIKAQSIIHIHIGQAFTPEMVWLIAKLRRTKYVAQLHIDFEPSGPVGILLPLYKRVVLKRVLHGASAIIALSDTAAQSIRDTYEYPGIVHVLNNGLDEVFFRLHRRPFTPQPPAVLRLLFVGRLSKQKNIISLLQAIRATHRNVHVDVIGDGEEYKTITHTVRTYNLSNVTMHGRLTRQEVMQFYEVCDALILPSLYEAQPLVLLEAMAARIPIIGTNVRGIAEHIKDMGIIVEPTAEGLANGIERYYADYNLLPQMVQRGHAATKKLRWRHTRKKYEALYETIART